LPAAVFAILDHLLT